MSDNNATKRDRKFFEQLLRDVDNETRQSLADEEKNLFAEDPMGKNYARWATEDEMINCLTAIPMDAINVNAAGVPIFCKDRTIYTDSKDSHSLIIGASGSKKTRLFILPSILTLMKAGESMIITDPKAELYERTSGKLKENGYEVLCINFRDDSRKNSWNPLDVPRQFFNKGKFDLAVGLLNDFCTIAVPSSDNRGDPFWDDTSRATFMGLLLIMFLLAETPSEINVRGVLHMRNSLFAAENIKNSSFYKLHKLMDPGSLVASYLSAVAVAPERTMSSILATLDTHLLKFIMRPDLTDMLCCNDVDFSLIGKEKTAIFLVMPDEKETYHGLISIFIQQCYESLIFEAQNYPDKALPRRVNFLLDEFSSLPPIKEFPAMISAARSRNIRFNIVVQSEKQLRSRYHEEADTIKGNCNNWFFLYSRELQTLEELSRLCGSQKSGKPLITPSRLQRLDKDKGEVLIIHGREYPFLSHLDDVNEYDNNEFTNPYCKVSTEQEIHVFRADQIIENRSPSWITARFESNTVKQAEAEREEKLRLEEERKKKEAEEAALLEEKKKMVNIDWLCVQSESLSDNPILSASEKSYAASYSIPIPDLSSHKCKFILHKENKESDKTEIHRIVPDAAFSLNYISMLCEMNSDNIILQAKDEQLVDHVAHLIFRRSLAAGQSIPVYFDMSKLSPEWNAIIQQYRSDKASLLIMHLAHMLFGTDLPPIPEIPADSDIKKLNLSLPDDLRCDTDRLIEEFSRVPDGMPKYLLILSKPESAPYAFDGLWQLLCAANFPNVRVFVATSEPEYIFSQCLDYIRKKNYKSDPITYKDNEPLPIFSHRQYLYFDEEKNEVRGKQPDFSAIILEVEPC